MEATFGTREREASLESSTKSESAGYLVTLRLPDEPASGRTEVAEQNIALGDRFRECFKKLVQDNDLQQEVGYMGEAMNLPFITITTTSRVADLIREMPEVESIFEDTPIFKHNA